MRKSREETAKTRERIVAAASAEFRRNGIAATGLNGLMAAAGLTHGGFYKHFSSKEELIAEATRHFLDNVVRALAERARQMPQEDRLKTFLDGYLSIAHRDDPAQGCGFAAVGNELARAGDETRAAAAHSFQYMVDTLVEFLPERGRPDDIARAQTLTATVVGAVSLARAVGDPALSKQILENTRETLLAVL
jgi:TetR/AcrR family transcriptional repressor of nem operon